MAGFLKLGFDARMVDHTGIGSYIRNLLTEYEKLEFLKFVTVYGNGKNPFFYSLKIPRLVEARIPIYSMREQMYFMMRMDRDNLVFHSPHYNAPLPYRGRLVLTIHDLIHLKYPEHLPSAKARIYARAMLGRVSRKAARIITSSESSKNDIMKMLKVPGEKITVIPLGVNEKFRPVSDEGLLDEFRTEHGLPEHFLLYAGSMKKHKNLGLLLEVFENIRKTRGIDISLVMAAYGRHDREFGAAVREKGLGRAFKFLPFIPEGKMPLLYNCADVFIFPSLSEGFGLPPLEAMACGVPSVVSGASSLPEVTGDAAVTCDPQNPLEFEEGIVKLLTDKQARGMFRQRGIARAGKFSWRITAEKTINVYNECSCA